MLSICPSPKYGSMFKNSLEKGAEENRAKKAKIDSLVATQLFSLFSLKQCF